MTHGDQIPISLSALQRLDARDAFAHADMDDTETVVLIGESHTFGKKHGDCRERVLLQPISP